ncbi:MAG TPA: hypothetical protein DFR83_10440 [Deltaproteobacteria bacterium]|nr:hypothetical protein [Deltaproteobacteria bacterium]
MVALLPEQRPGDDYGMVNAVERWASEAVDACLVAAAHPDQASKLITPLIGALQAALAETPGDPRLREIEAQVRFAEATVHAQKGRNELADMAFRRLLEEYEELGKPLLVADCLNALTVVAERRGDFESGLTLLERCFHLRSQHGASLRKRVRVLMNIGIAQAQLDDHPAALATFRFAEELLSDSYPEVLGIIETNRALIYRGIGEVDQAHALLTSAVSILEPLGSSVHLINAQLELVVEEIRRDALEDAERRLGEMGSMVEAVGVILFIPEKQLVTARLRLARGEYAVAEAAVVGGLEHANDEQRARLLGVRAEIAEASGDFRAALRWTREAHKAQLAVVEARSDLRIAHARARLASDIDRTQRTWMRDELARAQAEVQALSTRLEDHKSLLAAAAHDMNNPLSVVLLLGELASSAPESLEQSAEAIVDAARHMQSMVTTLLQSNRPSSVSASLHMAPTPLKPVLDAAWRRCEPLAAAKAHVLRLDVDAEDPCVEGDANALARVLDNLLSNAIKYTPPGGAIDLKASRQGAHVTVEVLDTGPGLSPDDLERVFLFPQPLSAQPTNGECQHGLGLVNVRRLVKKMGGRVLAENRPQGGARFGVELRASL